jgi:uncharacterized protein YcgI (DUF1989 family)
MLKTEILKTRFGHAIRLRAEQRVDIVNTKGTQVADTWAFNSDDPSEHMSMEHTRSVNSCIYARAGDVLSTNRRRPIIRLEEDTSPGNHDMLLCACNRSLYKELGCKSYHRNCEDNLHEALGSVGLTIPTTPSPLNLFMNVLVDTDGAVVRGSPSSKPGDAVRLKALMDCILVVSLCPQDIKPINGPACLPTEMELRFA